MRRRTITQDRRRVAFAFERLETRTVLAAPAASGPATASVIQGNALAFAGPSLVSVTDADATATESVSVSVSAGTVSLNLAAPPAARRSSASSRRPSSTRASIAPGRVSQPCGSATACSSRGARGGRGEHSRRLDDRRPGAGKPCHDHRLQRQPRSHTRRRSIRQATVVIYQVTCRNGWK
jgi:hypothetical protein